MTKQQHLADLLRRALLIGATALWLVGLLGWNFGQNHPFTTLLMLVASAATSLLAIAWRGPCPDR